jgi:hypothetical protein
MEHVSGALAGWRRTRTAHGIVLSLQVATSTDDAHRGKLGRVDVALNERQLRSLARDLARATEQRDMEVFARPRWWQRLLPPRNRETR